MRVSTLLAALGLFLLWGCANEAGPVAQAEAPKAAAAQDCPPPGVVPGSNLEMGAILKEIYQRGSSDPSLQFANHAAAAMMHQRAAAATDLAERMRWSTTEAFE